MTQNSKLAQLEHNCEKVPYFERLNYQYGQMLGVRDFCTAHDYFHNRQKLINRCLLGYGVVCGLGVSSEVIECKSKTGEIECKPHLIVEPGVALDILGNEIVVRKPIKLALSDIICVNDFDLRGKDPEFTVFATICFSEIFIEPLNVDCSSTCHASNTQTYARKQDCPKVSLTLTKPPSVAEETCDPCCSPTDACCLWLAELKIRWVGNQFEIVAESIDNSIRRPVSLYRPTTITGINWVHGARYSEEEAEPLLKEGLLVKFSRPVLKETLRDGIVDVWVTNDWSGPGNGQFRSLACRVTRPVNKAATDQLEIHIDCKGLQGDERVLITLRTDFLLDECGRAIDGNHIGGLVPLLPGSAASEEVIKQKIDPEKIMPPPHWGPWQSGNGTPGGSFVSWFFVEASNTNVQYGRRP